MGKPPTDYPTEQQIADLRAAGKLRGAQAMNAAIRRREQEARQELASEMGALEQSPNERERKDISDKLIYPTEREIEEFWAAKLLHGDDGIRKFLEKQRRKYESGKQNERP